MVSTRSFVRRLGLIFAQCGIAFGALASGIQDSGARMQIDAAVGVNVDSLLVLDASNPASLPHVGRVMVQASRFEPFGMRDINTKRAALTVRSSRFTWRVRGSTTGFDVYQRTDLDLSARSGQRRSLGVSIGLRHESLGQIGRLIGWYWAAGLRKRLSEQWSVGWTASCSVACPASPHPDAMRLGVSFQAEPGIVVFADAIFLRRNAPVFLPGLMLSALDLFLTLTLDASQGRLSGTAILRRRGVGIHMRLDHHPQLGWSRGIMITMATPP